MYAQLWRQLGRAARPLASTPSLVAAVVVTLGVAIGATVVVFSLVYGVLLKPFPYPSADRLVDIGYVAPGWNSTDLPSAPFMHFTLDEHATSFDGVGIWDNQATAVTSLEQPRRVETIKLTADVLRILGIQPALGRLFSTEDDQPGAAKTVVLTWDYWQRYLGSDEAVLGRPLTIDGSPHEIIGVMPRGFRFLDEDVEIFTPLQLDRAETRLGLFGYSGLGRLGPGVTLENAHAEVESLIPVAIDAFPPFAGASRDLFRSARFAPKLEPLRYAIVGGVSTTLLVLMGTVAIVLVIACANVANLFLIRFEGRRRELAIRSALGADRKRLVTSVLTESLILSTAGGIVGCALAYFGIRILRALGPENFPRLADVSMGGYVLPFALSITVLAAALFAFLPASRYTRPKIGSLLNAAGRSASGGKEAQHMRGALIVVQVALVTVLMIAAGLLFRTFEALTDVDPGFTGATTVQTFRIDIPQERMPDAEEAARAMQSVLDEIESLPGVEAAAFGSSVPLDGFRTLNSLYAQGADYGPEGVAPTRRLKFVSPGFFETLGVPLVAGRDFSWTDYFEYRPVTVVSESLARQEWGSPAAALGRQVRPGEGDAWREVVGVFGDVLEDGLASPAPATAYFPILLAEFWGAPRLMWRPNTVLIRTPRAGANALLDDVRQAVWKVDSSLPVASPRTLADLYDRALAPTSFVLVVLATSGAMAMLLGLVGIYGVIAYVASRRFREFGIRLALGATERGIVLMVWTRGIALAGAGIVLGLLAATMLTKWLEAELFGVTASDPSTFVVVSAVLLAVTSIASGLPSYRIARREPMAALRDE